MAMMTWKFTLCLILASSLPALQATECNEQGSVCNNGSNVEPVQSVSLLQTLNSREHVEVKLESDEAEGSEEEVNADVAVASSATTSDYEFLAEFRAACKPVLPEEARWWMSAFVKNSWFETLPDEWFTDSDAILGVSKVLCNVAQEAGRNAGKIPNKVLEELKTMQNHFQTKDVQLEQNMNAKMDAQGAKMDARMGALEKDNVVLRQAIMDKVYAQKYVSVGSGKCRSTTGEYPNYYRRTNEAQSKCIELCTFNSACMGYVYTHLRQCVLYGAQFANSDKPAKYSFGSGKGTDVTKANGEAGMLCQAKAPSESELLKNLLQNATMVLEKLEALRDEAHNGK